MMTRQKLLDVIAKAKREKATRLDLSGQQLTELPTKIWQLTALIELDLSFNRLRTVPAEIGQLTTLQTLNLRGNKLTAVPTAILKLTALKRLDLSENRLNAVTATIGKLTALKTLTLDHNALTVVPAEIGQLTTLFSIWLGDNALTAVPPEIGQLTALYDLNLINNKLTTVPAEIGQLTALTRLDLTNNKLTALPAEIGHLTALKTLALRNNELTAVPAEIGQLTALRELFLHNNALTSVPAEIGQLTHLHTLLLSGNKLTAVPTEILQLTALGTLDLRGNPLPIPPEILDKWDDAQAILAYIRDNLAPSHRPLHEAKLLVLGQATVGKTSLIRRLTQGDYDPHENKTEGIAIQRWPLAVAEQAMQVNLWDFGGQDIMHATHQFFLSKRSLYLLVLDNRANETDNRLDYWLKIIQSFGGDSPVIVVGNKSDQHPLDLDKRGLLYKYPTIAAIVETSCANGTGIAALQAAIEQTLAGLPHIHDELPGTWFHLRQKLEALGRDYLSQQEYTTLCQAGDITDPIAQSTLLGFLHDLGVVLNFRDDPRLEDTSILNPHWVTQAVYKVLNARDILAQNGLLTLATLHRLLDGPAYPRAKQMYILEMLRKFELCYDLEGQRDVVLLPDLLPKEQPDLFPFLLSSPEIC